MKIEGYGFEIQELKDLAERNEMTESDIMDLLYQFVDDMVAYYHLKK